MIKNRSIQNKSNTNGSSGPACCSFFYNRLFIGTGMENSGIGKSKTLITVKTEYIPNSVVIKTALKKSSGYISVVLFESGDKWAVQNDPNNYKKRL